ncbi:MAG: ABC transporter ATP-binding protein [Dehalococcoidia bacterium]|nr:ABC transporter ATP-binding protein [Dehalococcoidia bacterium]
MSDAPVIETRNVSMRFSEQQGWRGLFRVRPGKLALDAVNLTIRQGEVFGLLGPNGAGKTTLVKILSTLLIPTAGEARIAGLNVVRDGLRARRRIGVLYGDERLFFWRLSAVDNLMFYAALYGIHGKEARRRVLEVLDMVGLSESAHMRLHHYSTGMKRRASIARALLNDPDVLIMDEVNVALDPIAAAELRELIKERVTTGERTVLITTNVMAEAEFLCDRVAFIAGGRIQMVGEIAHIRNALQTNKVFEMVVGGLTNASIEALRAAPGVDALDVVPLDGKRYRLDLNLSSNGDTVPMMVRRVVETGGEVWSCGPRELTMDQMFAIIVGNSHKDAERERIPA